MPISEETKNALNSDSLVTLATSYISIEKVEEIYLLLVDLESVELILISVIH